METLGGMIPVPKFVKFVNVNSTQIRLLTPFHERSHVGISQISDGLVIRLLG